MDKSRIAFYQSNFVASFIEYTISRNGMIDV